MRITDDGMIVAVDLVMVMTSLERDQAGLALRRVSSKNLLSIKMIERKMPGKELLDPNSCKNHEWFFPLMKKS